MKFHCSKLSALALAVFVSGCAAPSFEGGAVPTRADAITMANQLCPDPFKQRKGQWRASLRDGTWKVSRDMGKQSIRIDARTGKTDGCRSI